MRSGDSFIVTKDDIGEYNLVDRSILEEYSIKADMDYEGSKQVKEDGFNYEEHLLEPKYNVLKLVELLDLNSYHENCVDVVARDSAGLTYTFNSTEDSATNDVEFTDKEVLDFLQNCNPSINTLLYRRMYDRRSIGYGAIEVIRESTADSPVLTLAHIPAQTLRRYADGFRVLQQVGTKKVYFVIYGKNYVDGKKVDVHADYGTIHPYNSLPPEQKANELLWTQDYAPGTNYYGRPKIIGSLSTILGDLSRGKYNISFFSNYGVPAFAVTITGDFADYEPEPGEKFDVTQTLKYKISQQLKEVIRNPHSALTILIPSEGEEGNVEVNLQPLSVETKEASFRLFRKDNRDEILHAHKVDPSRLGIFDAGKLNGNNANQTDNAYKVSTIAPLKADNETDIQNLLIGEFNLSGWEFKINDLDPQDFRDDVSVLKELFNMAAITPNQIINLVGGKYGLNNVDNAYLDEYYLNGVPLEQIWNNSTDNGNFDERIFDDLEATLIDEAEEYDKTTETIEDGNSNQKSTKSNKPIKSLKHRITDIFKN